MDRMIYISMAGAKMNMQRQEVLSNNLANATTTGFRAELQAVRAVPVRGDGASTRVYALDTTVGYDHTAGPINFTGRALDVATRGQAMLSVQALDGTEAYTRAGALSVNAEGTLVTQSGLPVLGDGGPIAVPQDTKPSIAPDGTVSVRQQDGAITPIGRLKLVTPEAKLERGDDGLFRSPLGDLPADANAQLQDGALEGSNVNPIEAMVSMITAARQFETQMKMIKTSEEDERVAAQLLRSGG